MPSPFSTRANGSLEPNERSSFTMIEIDEVIGCHRIVPLAHEDVLRVFKGGSDFYVLADAQKQRMRVIGQAVDQVCPECCEVQRIVGDEHGHARPAVGAGNRHAVDAGLLDAGKRTDRL